MPQRELTPTQEGDSPPSAPRIQTAALMAWATGRADRSGNVFRFGSLMAIPHGIAGRERPRGGGDRGAQTHLPPRPHQALGLGGRL